MARRLNNTSTLNSTWLQLKPGMNLIKYDAESGLNNLECSVFYTPLYLGV